MKKRAFLLSAVSLILVLSTLAACATPTPEVIEKVVTQIVKETVKETVIVEGTPQTVDKEVTKVVTVEVEGERAFSTEKEKVVLKGFAQHEKGVRDVVVFAGDTKVAYLPNRDRGGRRMSFSVEVPLEVGANQITIVARHDEENTSTEWVFVRRNER